MNYSEYIMRGISNIIWHIEVNGKTLGAERTIEMVHKSLKNMLNDYNRIINKNIK